MSEPTTEAGRRLLDDYPARYGGALYTDPVSRQLTIEAIAAIEAEARADLQDACQAAGLPRDAALWLLLDTMVKRERDRIASEMEALPGGARGPRATALGEAVLSRAAVLAIVRGDR